MRRVGHVAAAAVAVLTTLALAGCGEVSPGAAATVDGQAIPLDEVDEVARALCTYTQTTAELQGSPPEQLATTDIRREVLGTRLNAALAEVVSDELGVDVPPSSYEGGTSQIEPVLEQMPAAEADVLRDYVDTLGRLRELTAAIGEDRGDSNVAETPETAISRGYLLRLAQGTDIELDPRFGQLRQGRLVGGSGSLSVPADAGSRADPPPASQTCS